MTITKPSQETNSSACHNPTKTKRGGARLRRVLTFLPAKELGLGRVSPHQNNLHSLIESRMNHLLCLLLFLCLSPMVSAQVPTVPGRSTFVVTRDGVRIHCLEKGTGPAILFIPDWTMPAEIWEYQISFFSRAYHVVAMDPRSQGRSAKTSDGHYPAARARDIKAVVDQLRLSPVVLVGWSMGVNEVMAYVDQFGTTTVAQLVLVDGIAGGDYDAVATPAVLRYATAFQRDRMGTTSEFVRGMFKKPQSEEFLTRLVASSLETPTDSAMALFLGAFTTDNRPALAKIDAPTLIVVAGNGSLLPVYQEMQKRIAGSRLEIFENAGHALFVDEPGRFNLLLHAFLKPK
jgi:non-heme chloroperoxidase